MNTLEHLSDACEKKLGEMTIPQRGQRWTTDELKRLKCAINQLVSEENADWTPSVVSKKIDERKWIRTRNYNGIEKKAGPIIKKRLREHEKGLSSSSNSDEMEELIKNEFCLAFQVEIAAGAACSLNPDASDEVESALENIARRYHTFGTGKQLYQHVSQACQGCIGVWSKFVERRRPEIAEEIRQKELERLYNEESQKMIDAWRATFKEAPLQEAGKSEKKPSSKFKRPKAAPKTVKVSTYDPEHQTCIRLAGLLREHYKPGVERRALLRAVAKLARLRIDDLVHHFNNCNHAPGIRSCWYILDGSQ